MKAYKLLILLIFVSVISNAQGIDPGLPGGDPDVPIDGGLGLLVLAGIIYGARKVQEIKP
ncbi:MAG: hypothetical protein EOP48_08200 [Sphingobacteriales bacterium]|nr:MAG: hypothetical protein EOP48_08200 [Sphingobacteriales bacterium]